MSQQQPVDMASTASTASSSSTAGGASSTPIITESVPITNASLLLLQQQLSSDGTLATTTPSAAAAAGSSAAALAAACQLPLSPGPLTIADTSPPAETTTSINNNNNLGGTVATAGTASTVTTRSNSISIMAADHHHHSHHHHHHHQRSPSLSNGSGGGGHHLEAVAMASASLAAAAAAANVANGTAGGQPPTVDHCNRAEGFHDGLRPLPLNYDTEEDFVSDSAELEKLENCAFQSRLPMDAMNEEEVFGFRDMLDEQEAEFLPLYLLLRNSILRLWYRNPKDQLLFADVISHIAAMGVDQVYEKYLEKYPYLLWRVYAFLQRQAYINFGIFAVSTDEPDCHFKPGQSKPKRRQKVIILGAGIAGIIAARQLQFFGFEVFVLEARNRIGGRVCTYKQGEHIADVGSTVICGLGGNPLRVLEKQIPAMKLKRIGQKCNLYLNNELIDRSKDEVMETLFNNILEGTVILAHRMNFTTIGNRSVSLGEAIDVVIELQEREVRERYLKHLMTIKDLEEKLATHLSDLKEARETIVALYDALRESNGLRAQRSVNADYAQRVNRVQLSRAVARVKELEEEVIPRIEGRIAALEAMELPRQYLSTEDQRVLDWHFANLEFATASSLKNLSVQHWDQDDDYQFTGPQLAIKNGYACIPYSLAADVDVRLNMAVRSVRLLADGVEVVAVKLSEEKEGGEEDEEEEEEEVFHETLDKAALAKRLGAAQEFTFTADAVLCTLPLGVLKNSLAASQPANGTSAEGGEKPAPSTGGGKKAKKGAAKASTSALASTDQKSSSPPQPPNRIEFQPPLPEDKVGAIRRLGYGILNKVVLIFDSVFWESKDHLFGHVASTTETRGELFLFWSIYQQPILMALIAGDSACALEAVSDEAIRAKVMAILAGIFKEAFTGATLTSYYVTRWAADPWAMGSYSYVGADSSGRDYDLLAEPVPLAETSPEEEEGAPKTKPSRLFFAGEHTIRQYPATVHGALLSGTREATRIANQYLGVPYIEDKNKDRKRRSRG